MLVATAAVLVGCAVAGGPPARVRLVRAKGYRVTVPPGWEPVVSRADVAVREPRLGAVLMAHGTCEGAAPRRPLPVLARHLRFGLREVRELEQGPVPAGGHQAWRSRFRATLEGVPVAVSALTVRAGGCVYDLAVVAPPEGARVAEAAFEAFSGSFALLGGP